MDFEQQMRQLEDQLDLLVARVDDLVDDGTSGATPQAQENRTIGAARARLAREQARRLRIAFRRVAAHGEDVREDWRRLLGARAAATPGPVDQDVRTDADLVGQAKGVLRHRHRIGADLARECLDSTARLTGLDVLNAACLVLDSIHDERATESAESLDAVLGRIAPDQVDVHPVTLHIVATGGRPMVQLRYRSDGAETDDGSAEFVALQPPTGRAVSYEIVAPRADLLDESELSALLGPGRGLRWIHPSDPHAPLLWPDGESLVAAITNRRAAARVAAHLHCPLEEREAPPLPS